MDSKDNAVTAIRPSSKGFLCSVKRSVSAISDGFHRKEGYSTRVRYRYFRDKDEYWDRSRDPLSYSESWRTRRSVAEADCQLQGARVGCGAGDAAKRCGAEAAVGL